MDYEYLISRVFFSGHSLALKKMPECRYQVPREEPLLRCLSRLPGKKPLRSSHTLPVTPQGEVRQDTVKLLFPMDIWGLPQKTLFGPGAIPIAEVYAG